MDHVAVRFHWQYLGMRPVQPQWGGRGGGGQVDGDAGLAELADNAVQPVEIPGVLGGLDAVPAEDGQGHGVDAGLGHQADVLVPDLLGPLVGVVVAAVRDAASGFGQQVWPAEWSADVHRRGAPCDGYGMGAGGVARARMVLRCAAALSACDGPAYGTAAVVIP